MDWLLHFTAGLMISLSVSYGTGEPKYGLYAGYAAGTADKIYEASRGDRLDKKDSLATFAGAVAGYGAYKIFERKESGVEVPPKLQTVGRSW